MSVNVFNRMYTSCFRFLTFPLLKKTEKKGEPEGKIREETRGKIAQEYRNIKKTEESRREKTRKEAKQKETNNNKRNIGNIGKIYFRDHEISFALIYLFFCVHYSVVLQFVAD